MSNTRYPWWGYVKNILKKYPNVSPDEKSAVDLAIGQTQQMQTGAERMKLVNMIFFKKTHNLAGVCFLLHISERTAQRWHADFIRTVAVNFKCNSLMEDGEVYDPDLEES